MFWLVPILNKSRFLHRLTTFNVAVICQMNSHNISNLFMSSLAGETYSRYSSLAYILISYFVSRIIYTHRGDVMGSWVVDFEFHFKNLKEDPTISDKGITITPKVGAEFSACFLHPYHFLKSWCLHYRNDTLLIAVWYKNAKRRNAS